MFINHLNEARVHAKFPPHRRRQVSVSVLASWPPCPHDHSWGM